VESLLDLLNEELEKEETVLYCSLSDEQMKTRSNNNFGGPCSLMFTVWTNNRVIFTTEYDDVTIINSVDRNPPKKRNN
jgi:hypothetical protein